MRRHDVASTLRRCCINVMCPLGHAFSGSVTISYCEIDHKVSVQQEGFRTNEKIWAVTSKTNMSAVWSKSSLGAFFIANDSQFLHADTDGTSQTAPLRRLISHMSECTFSNVADHTWRYTYVQDDWRPSFGRIQIYRLKLSTQRTLQKYTNKISVHIWNKR